jgi:hypothetical protein
MWNSGYLLVWSFYIFPVFFVILAPMPPLSADIPAERSDAARAYLSAIEPRGVDAQVVYLTPGDRLPETSFVPPPPPAPVDVDADFAMSRIVLTALGVAALLAVLFVVSRFGGARSASFARPPDAARRRQAAPAAPPLTPDTLDLGALDLARITLIADRRAALEALWLAALARAATAHGLTIGRSWTARDALKRVPGAWPHRAALTRLARAAELAHFGGRDVTEDQFRTLIDAAAPIFGRTAP